MSDEIKNIHWTATLRARDEAAINTAGLSIRQRKLLTMMGTPITAALLADASKLPVNEVEISLKRFATLGFAISDEVIPPSPMSARPSAFATTTTTITPPKPTATSAFTDASAPKTVTIDTSMRGAAPEAAKSKMPIYAGGVALTVLAAAIWFFTRSTTPPPAIAAPLTSAAPVAAAPAPDITPAVTTPPVTASVAPAVTPATPTKPPTPREIAAEKVAADKAAKDAAKVAADAAKVAADAAKVAAAQKQNPTVATTQTPATVPAAAPAPAPTPTPAPAATATGVA
jgi:hypothetical protein